MCMQDYKSMCAAVTIYAILLNIQTDRQHLISLYEQLSQLSQMVEYGQSTVGQICEIDTF